jgi:flagellar biosynthesis/type III secretory pathway protein FliH
MNAARLKAQEQAAIVAGDKEALREIHLREMGLSDWTSGVNHARREGIQEGIREGMQKGIREGMQKGIREGREEAAKEIFELLNKGKTIEETRKILGLE